MIDQGGSKLDQPTRRASALSPVLMGVIFLGLAAWFVWGADLVRIPRTNAVPIAPGHLDTAPRRDALGDPPLIVIGGFRRACMECHRFFESAPETARRLNQHTHIVLDHGLNDRCFNCHDRDDRNRLALRGNKTIPFTEAPRLCAKCHGPTYRDWQHGMHGRTNGYWDETRGEARRLKCVECHDPHAPAFPAFEPLPAPNTLRMGKARPRAHGTAVDELDPLRKWHYEPHEPPRPRDLPPVPLAAPRDDGAGEDVTTDEEQP